MSLDSYYLAPTCLSIFGERLFKLHLISSIVFPLVFFRVIYHLKFSLLIFIPSFHNLPACVISTSVFTHQHKSSISPWMWLSMRIYVISRPLKHLFTGIVMDTLKRSSVVKLWKEAQVKKETQKTIRLIESIPSTDWTYPQTFLMSSRPVELIQLTGRLERSEKKLCHLKNLKLHQCILPPHLQH